MLECSKLHHLQVSKLNRAVRISPEPFFLRRQPKEKAAKAKAYTFRHLH